MAEKISIVTISFNSRLAIEKTIQSILLQNYRPLEYILVDGGSNDGTIDIIMKYIPKLERAGIEVNFKSEPDKGISDAFNKGIDRATGDIIGITNADDAILPEVLTFVANNFPKGIDVFYGNILWVEKERSYIRKSSPDLSDLKFQLKALHPAVYIRKNAYEKYGDYDINYKYCMDKELLARFQRLGAKFQYTDKTLVSVAAGGVSDRNIEGVAKEGERIAVANGVREEEAKKYFEKNIKKQKIKRFIKKMPFVATFHAVVNKDRKGNNNTKYLKKPWIYDLYRWTGKTNFTTRVKMYFVPKYRIVRLFRKCQFYKEKCKVVFFVYRLIYEHYAVKYGVDIGTSTNIGPGFIIRHVGGIAINGGATIGKDVEILQGVTIGYERRGKRQGNPVIGNQVWIGSNAIVVGNIEIGNDVLIAPGAYVNFNVPDHSIVIGNPGKIISKENATESYVINTINYFPN